MKKVLLAFVLFSIWNTLLYAQQVTLDKGVDLTTALSGQNIKFNLDWGCSSLTADCVNAQLIDSLPVGLEFVSATSAIVLSSSGAVVVPGVYNPSSHTVLWDFKNLVSPENGIPDGASGTVEIIVKIKPGVIQNNTVLTNKAVIPSSNAGNAGDGATTTVSPVSPQWSVSKSVISGPIYHDRPVKYRVSVCSDSPLGNLHLLPGATVVDALPPGAVFVSATNGGSHDGGTPGNVTWSFSDTLKVDEPCRNMEVTVTYPASDLTNNNTGLSTQIPKLNEATLTATAIGNHPVTETGSTNQALLPPFFDLNLNKYPSGGGQMIDGDIARFTIAPNNKSTVPVNDFTVTDYFPDQFDLIKLNIRAFDTLLPLTVKVELNHSGTFITWTTTNTQPAQMLDVATIPGWTPGTSFVSGLKMEMGTVPSGFGINETTGGQKGSFGLFFTASTPLDNVGDTTAYQTPYMNDAELTATRPLDGATLTETDSASMCIVSTTTAILDPSKSVTPNYVTPVAGDSTLGNAYFRGSRVKYCVSVENDGEDPDDDGDPFDPISPANILNPVGSDLLPSEMTYESGSWTIAENTTGDAYDNSGTNPVFETVPNFNGTGKTLLRWRFTGTFEPGEYVTICFNATIADVLPDSTLVTNNFAMSTESDFSCGGTECVQTTTGLNDYFGETADPSTLLSGIDQMCLTNVELYAVDTTTIPTPSKSVTSTGPYAPTGSDPVELGLSTDTVSYTIGLCNSPYANLELKDPILMDLLPEELIYVSGSAALESNTTGLTLDGSNPVFEVVENFAGTGRTLLRWKFTGLFPINKCVEYRFKARIKTGSGGNVPNEPFSVGQARDYECAFGQVLDDNDYDGDSNIGEAICKSSAPAEFSIPVIKSFGAKKFVKGAKDAAYLGSDLGKLGVGSTYPADSVLWRFKISNPGNVTLTDAVVFDIFPFPGDVGVQLNTTPRESEWTPYLVAPITSPDPDVTVFYSESTNPCRPEVSPTDPSGCVNDWTSTPPGDLSLVKSIKLDFINEDIEPAEEFWFDLKMLAPDSVDMAPGIAWNSIARDAVEVPAQEPNKVGILVPGFDIALKKTLSSGQSFHVRPDTDVNFDITVENQSTDTVKNIKIYDYLPTTMTLNDGDWTSIDPSTASYVIAGPLAPGATATVQITLHVSPSAPIGNADNFSEVGEMRDLDGNVVPDWDSPNDNSRTNDLGGVIGTPDDDNLLGRGANPDPDEDEDDHDGARVNICLIAATIVPTDAICFAANGSLDLTVTDATGSVTYAWSNGSTIEDPSAPAGSYTVTVTDAVGCTATATATINQPPAVAISESVTHVLCNGDATGAIDITVTNATAPIIYAWAPGGQTTEDISGLTAGTYDVSVSDANGCTATKSIVVSEPPVLAGVVVDKTCAPMGGLLDLTVTGGRPGYTYLWSDAGASTSEDLTTTSSGPFTVTITDANGCTTSATGTIVEPVPLNISGAVVVNALCFGSNGSIDITVADGTPGYSFSWSNGSTSEDLVATAGTYTVTVTDSKGCTTTTQKTINEPTDLVLSATPTQPLCPGGSNGSIDLSVSGGTPGYSFEWSPGGATTEDISSLTAGTYTVTVTDLNNCKKTLQTTVNQPDAISPTATTTSVCPGKSTGAVDLTVSGGTADYTYEWSNGPTTQDISGLPAGDYTVTVTDDNGCTASNTFTVGTFPAPTVTVDGTEICSGTTTTLVAVGTGSFEWSTGATTASIDVTPSFSTIYSVTLTDSNGCTATDDAAVDVVTQPAAGADSTLVCSGGNAPSTCDLGQAGNWAVFSQPAGAMASVDGSGMASGMTLPGNYVFRLSVSGNSVICHDDVQITVPYCKVAIGNLVFMDNNANGKFDAGDMGIDGVVVQLYLSTADIGVDMPSSTTTTSGGGFYLFDQLNPGTYVVYIPGSNFGAGNILETKISSTPQGGDNLSDDDADENGQNTLDDGGVRSTDIVLLYGTEPSTETGAGAYPGILDDDDANMTVDFGFVCNASVSVANAEICFGQTATLTATGSPGSLLWNTNETSASIDVSPTTTADYMVTLTTANGCTVADTATVTVIPLPNAGPDDSLVCPPIGQPAPTSYDLNQTGSWSVFSQPAGANAQVNGDGLVTDMTLAGDYVIRLSVTGTSTTCHDDVKITVPDCPTCPPKICLPVQVVKN